MSWSQLKKKKRENKTQEGNESSNLPPKSLQKRKEPLPKSNQGDLKKRVPPYGEVLAHITRGKNTGWVKSRQSEWQRGKRKAQNRTWLRFRPQTWWFGDQREECPVLLGNLVTCQGISQGSQLSKRTRHSFFRTYRLSCLWSEPWSLILSSFQQYNKITDKWAMFEAQYSFWAGPNGWLLPVGLIKKKTVFSICMHGLQYWQTAKTLWWHMKFTACLSWTIPVQSKGVGQTCFHSLYCLFLCSFW